MNTVFGKTNKLRIKTGFFYRCPEHHNCRGISRRMHASSVIKAAVLGVTVKKYSVLTVVLYVVNNERVYLLESNNF